MTRIKEWNLGITFLLLCYICPSETHIALTFPPARKYDLDFLDNSRTKPPCGMPTGDKRTSFLAESKANITWRMGYLHEGGFKIELLDELERPVLDLTPTIKGSNFVTSDITAQQFEIQLPSMYTCTNCTLRLVRQALEWGSNFTLWSCADIDIQLRSSYRETCSRHGKYLIGRCKCDRLYYGNRCQYRAECLKDSDCGSQGKCLEIGSEHQCYCNLGWFGRSCNRRSPFRTMEIDFSLYREKVLNETFKLYWRIVKEHKEIEMVLVANTTNYIGIGWRPKHLNETCRNFPEIHDYNEKFNGVAENGTLETNDVKMLNKSETESRMEIKEFEQRKSGLQEEMQNNGILTEENSSSSLLSVNNSLMSDNDRIVLPDQMLEEKGRKPLLLLYSPTGDFSPMDCTDIVVGSARGTLSRIGDYYTRDRSTPRVDDFWGGKDDLVAASGFEINNVTTIMFRKKLLAKHPTDHTIENDLMHVIWALGHNSKKHPLSSTVTKKSKVLNPDEDFYKPNEFKYHGQRGFLLMNFFETNEELHSKEQVNLLTDKINYCDGEWMFPRTCNPVNASCEYYVKWNHLPQKDELHFSISTKHTDKWTGIAFSNDEKMSQTDAILGWVDKSGKPFLMDTWITGYLRPLLDASQNIYNISGTIADGLTTLSFTRKRISNDPKDLSFTDDVCLYMMFPIKGGSFNAVNKKIFKHEGIPTISPERICIRSCKAAKNDSQILTNSNEITREEYYIQVKIVDSEKKFDIATLGSTEYVNAATTIYNNFKTVLNTYPGYWNLTITKLIKENDEILATIVLQANKTVEQEESLHDKGEESVKTIFANSIKSGQLGSLKVNPDYFKYENRTFLDVSDFSDEPSKLFSSETKFYITLGCLIAVSILVLLQAACTYCGLSDASQSNNRFIQYKKWKAHMANANFINKNTTNTNFIPEQTDIRVSNRKQTPEEILLEEVKNEMLARSNPRKESRTSTYPKEVRSQESYTQPDFYFMPSQRKS